MIRFVFMRVYLHLTSLFILFSAMEPKHRDIIDLNRCKIVGEVEVFRIIPGLVRSGILTKSLTKQIVTEQNPERRVEKLLDILRLRGPRAFHSFVGVLKEEYNLLAYLLMQQSYTREKEIYV